ncbi:hypothetical protein DKK66_11705 [Aquitalea sp. USM4]|nr:hypothetical protein DKK66_11705 [Aquitalea sp. USM4]
MDALSVIDILCPVSSDKCDSDGMLLPVNQQTDSAVFVRSARPMALKMKLALRQSVTRQGSASVSRAIRNDYPFIA